MKRVILSMLMVAALAFPARAQITVISGEQIKPENNSEQKTTPTVKDTGGVGGTHDGDTSKEKIKTEKTVPLVKKESEIPPKKVVKLKKIKRD